MTTLDRRSLLKGLGAATTLASPFFSSAVARGQTGRAPVRVVLVALQHGWGRDKDFDRVFRGSERDFVIPRPLQRLDAIREDCTFVDGVRGTLWGNAHDVSYSDIFTAGVPWDETGSEQLGRHFPEPMGPSLDWLIGQHHGRPVLRLSARYRSWGKRFHPLCFDDQARVQPFFTSPLDAWESFVGPLRDGLEPPAPGRVAAKNELLRFLGRDADRLLRRVRGDEQRRLEGYVQALNAVGDRILGAPSAGLGPEELPEAPAPDPGFEAEVDHYIDLVRVALAADTHRVAVLGLGDDLPGWRWRDEAGRERQGNVWGTNFHHEVAHHSTRNDPSLDPRLAYEGWVDWYVGKMVRLTEALRSTVDVDGRSVLDNTVIVLTGEVGSGTHDRRDKLHVLIGGGGGLRGGRWLPTLKVEPRQRQGAFIGGERRDGTRMESGINWGGTFSLHHTADLLTSIGRLAGLPLERIGLPSNNLSPIALL